MHFFYELKEDQMEIYEKVSVHYPPHIHKSIECIYVTGGTLELDSADNLVIDASGISVSEEDDALSLRLCTVAVEKLTVKVGSATFSGTDAEAWDTYLGGIVVKGFEDWAKSFAYNESSGLSLNLTRPVPEPSAFALLAGTAAAALAAVRRRRRSRADAGFSRRRRNRGARRRGFALFRTFAGGRRFARGRGLRADFADFADARISARGNDLRAAERRVFPGRGNGRRRRRRTRLKNFLRAGFRRRPTRNARA